VLQHLSLAAEAVAAILLIGFLEVLERQILAALTKVFLRFLVGLCAFSLVEPSSTLPCARRGMRITTAAMIARANRIGPPGAKKSARETLS
jgi:hypothetical protein